MKNVNDLYKDAKTGEILEKISNWEISEGLKVAYFKSSKGAIFSMYHTDVVRIGL